jgi:thiol-disulfide isomerase/thioredoxin
MNKILLASLALATACTTAYGQAQRRVLIEGFSQASCGPCASANPAYNALVQDANNAPRVVSLKYQVSWPGTDPMNAQYPDGPNIRRTYYGVTGVPDQFVDGVDQNATQNIINTRYAVTSPIELHVSHEWNTTANVDVTVKIKNVSASDFAVGGNHRLHVALVEKEIHFATPPGSNGETSFYGVVRQMHPNSGGTTLTTISAGDSLEYNFTVPVPNYIYGLNQVVVAAFVQNNANKAIENAQITSPAPLPSNVTDVSALNMTAAPTNYCATSFVPTIQVKNESATPLVNFRAYYSINGGAQVTQDVTGLSLASGQTHTVTFAAANLTAPSASVVAFGITNINQGQGTVDASSLDNIIPSVTYVTMSASAVGTEVEEGFESVATNATAPPNAVLVKTPGNITGFNVVATAGANGSSKSYKYDFYNVDNGTANLIFDKLDISGMNEPKLTFDYAYARYNANFWDRFQVQVSTDCGGTWATLFDKQSSDLATVPDVGTGAFTPNSPSQWVNVDLGLAAQSGATELLVAFKGISGYGNNFYLDNVNVFDANPVIIGVKDLGLNGSLVVFPNPTAGDLNVQFELTEMTDLNIVIYNALGQQVRSVANGAFNGLNNLNLNVSDLAAGIYQLHLVSDKGLMTQRFTVSK